jgi:hypothetical protein
MKTAARSIVIIAFVALAVMLATCSQTKEKQKSATDEIIIKKTAEPAGPAGPHKDYHKSLHATGEGMRHWYEAKDGFMRVTGKPYDELSCKGCHAPTCDKCHTKKEVETKTFTGTEAGKKENCISCHVRMNAAANMDKKLKIEDVHADMACTDCHNSKDIHGDGNAYVSMRDEGAVSASCSAADCHGGIDMEKRPHKVHKDKLACIACHMSSSISCYNCHFDKVVETKKRKGNFIPVKSWTMLVNFRGKVTTGNAQTLVCKGKKFVAYVPHFTHSVVKEAKTCADCHGSDAAKKMIKGESVSMGEFKDGKLEPFKGVVPFVPELIQWPWLDKDGDKWVKMKSDEKPLIQKAAYVEPLTKEQLEKLAKPEK